VLKSKGAIIDLMRRRNILPVTLSSLAISGKSSPMTTPAIMAIKTQVVRDRARHPNQHIGSSNKTLVIVIAIGGRKPGLATPRYAEIAINRAQSRAMFLRRRLFIGEM
jgi:hypothetical protein